MAQLPPKTPTIPQNWPFFPHQKMSPMANFNPTGTTQQQQYHQNHHQQQQQQNSPPPLSQQQLPSWVDEFLDFSSARRGTHRRSASDSIAFLEECRGSGSVIPAGVHGFDRLDEDQLMSMFSDDIASGGLPPALSNPSTPSDQNSNSDEKAMAFDEVIPVQEKQQPPKNNEQGEVESSCKNDTASPPPSAAPHGGETIFDPKRVKRILANRQSAQRSRVRKLQYISDLEKSVTTLQTEVSALSPRVAFLDHQRLLLNVDNSALKQRIAALAHDKIFKDAHQEALKKEIERLRQVHEQQKLQKRGNSMNNNMNGHSLPLPFMEKEQLLS